MKRRNISSRCELSGAKRSCSKSATFAFSWSDEDDDAVANEEVAEFLALFFLFRLKGLENLDKHLDEVDIMLDELELLELEVPSPALLPVIDMDPALPPLWSLVVPKRRAWKVSFPMINWVQFWRDEKWPLKMTQCDVFTEQVFSALSFEAKQHPYGGRADGWFWSKLMLRPLVAFVHYCNLLQKCSIKSIEFQSCSALSESNREGKRKPLIKKNTMRRRKLLFISTQNKNVKNDKYACKRWNNENIIHLVCTKAKYVWSKNFRRLAYFWPLYMYHEYRSFIFSSMAGQTKGLWQLSTGSYRFDTILSRLLPRPGLFLKARLYRGFVSLNNTRG